MTGGLWGLPSRQAAEVEQEFGSFARKTSSKRSADLQAAPLRPQLRILFPFLFVPSIDCTFCQLFCSLYRNCRLCQKHYGSLAVLGPKPFLLLELGALSNPVPVIENT